MFTRTLIACTCAAALLNTAPAYADGITASVDRTEISLQDTLQLTITVNGSKSAQPVLPSMPQFQVQGRGQSTQVHIINGSMSTSGTYTYELFPKQAGTFTIGPATVVIDRKPYQSEPFTIKVVQQATEPCPRAVGHELRRHQSTPSRGAAVSKSTQATVETHIAYDTSRSEPSRLTISPDSSR